MQRFEVLPLQRECRMRLGIFGGSFDPVHLGHLWIGEAAMETLQLDRLAWIPTATQPLKPSGAAEDAQHRLAMLQLAVSGREGFVVDPREIQRDGVSYSVDTVGEIKQEHPEAELFLIIGSDSLATMPQWHRPADLLSMVTLAVVQRPTDQAASDQAATDQTGQAALDFSVLDGLVSPERRAAIEAAVIAMPQIELSSSGIRQRVAAGQSIRYQVPAAVQMYLQTHHLYVQE